MDNRGQDANTQPRQEGVAETVEVIKVTTTPSTATSQGTAHTPASAAEGQGGVNTSTGQDEGVVQKPTGDNLRKGKDIIGLPVLTFDTGVQVDDVDDLLFDPQQNQVVALLVDNGGWFSSAKVIPWGRVKVVGPDSVIIPDASAIIPANTDPYIKRMMNSDNVLVNTEVYTTDGRDLGKIGDMFIDVSTGQVVGYEVSGGLVQSALTGKKFMPAPDTITVGRDAAFVPPQVGDAMEEQTGGLQGAVQSATNKVTQFTTDQQRQYVLGKTAGQDVRADDGTLIVAKGDTIDQQDVARADAYGKLQALFLAAGGGQLSNLADNVQSATSQASANLQQQRDQQLQNSIGKTVGTTVYADDGTLIAPQGTIVDQDTIRRARAHDAENELLAAVGMGSLQSTTQQVSSSVSDAWSGLKTKVEGLVQEQQDTHLQDRINHALGRPVTRVILDRQDNVILDTGQIITNAAIQQAQDAGVLDVLLDSVYEVEPEFDPSVLQAGESGKAALDTEHEERDIR